jgi:hypothetical protein
LRLIEIVSDLEGKYEIVDRRGIQARFKRDLTVYDLFDRDIYRNLFRN